MTSLPNPFSDSGVSTAFPPDDAGALVSSQSPGAPADIPATSVLRVPSYSGSISPDCHTRAADRQRTPPNPIECIGEIFAGARKLEPVEMWFENTAYPREDELLYEVLLALDDPHTADLIDIPYGMEAEFDEPPLFIQQQRRA